MTVESEPAFRAMKLDERIAVLKALADASRALVVNALLEKPHCVEELAERLHRAPSTISFHLRKLEEANLVTKTKTQYYLVYELRPDILQARLQDFIALPSRVDGPEQKRMKKGRDKVISTFMRKGVLLQMPRQWRKRRILLEEFLVEFEPGREYQEHQVNELIQTRYPDYCTIRRMLVDEGLMTRDGQVYRRLTTEEVTMEETRAELKRRYKETPTEAGIFVITNKENGKVLLGSSLNLRGPLNKHRFMLNHGSHWIKPLQADWKRFGQEAFTFEVVAVVERKDDPDFDVEEALSRLEHLWLEKLQPIGERGYNKDDKLRE